MITSMIFFPEKTFYERPSDYGFLFEDVSVNTEDRLRLHGWFLTGEKVGKDVPALGQKQAAAQPVLLFLHGNAGNISHRLFKAKGWIERGFHVFLMDYRGYGKSEGKIEHEEDLIRDAEAALRWLVQHKKIPESRIILYGESIGSAPAVRLGGERSFAALILEAPFTSVYDLARTHYPFVPEMLLKDFEFSNISRIEELKCPLFILHGTADEICPYAMAGELFEKAPEPKSFFSIPNGTHNDLPLAAGEDFWTKPCEFVNRYLL